MLQTVIRKLTTAVMAAPGLYWTLIYRMDYTFQIRAWLKYSKNGVWPVMLPIIRFFCPQWPGPIHEYIIWGA